MRAIGLVLGLCLGFLAACQAPVTSAPADQEIAPPSATAIEAPEAALYVAGQILAKPRAGIPMTVQPASPTQRHVTMANGAQMIYLTSPAMQAAAASAPYLADFNGKDASARDAAAQSFLDRQQPLVDEMDRAIAALEASGRYEWVSRNWVLQPAFDRRPPPSAPQPGPRPVAANRPNDPLYPRQWGFAPNGAGAGRSPGGSGFESFWSVNARTGDRSVVVAVIDTGLEAGHPDIAASGNVIAGFDMITDAWTANDGDGRDADATDPGDIVSRADPRRPPGCPAQSEASFHGTHVAGTIGAGATNNGVGVAGGNWRVSVMPVRALGRCGGAISDIADAILWAANLHDPQFGLPANPRPAAVINMSLGGGAACARMPILQDAINRARSAGVVVVAAAGNEASNAAGSSPASCVGVITVAASDARGVLAPYSNFGDTVEVLAPGGDMSRDDNGDGFPDGILSTRSAPCAPGGPAEQCRYSFFQGTSMAAPHVAAAAALLIFHVPEINAGPLEGRSDRVLAWIKRNGAARASTQCPRPCGGVLLNLEERAP